LEEQIFNLGDLQSIRDKNSSLGRVKAFPIKLERYEKVEIPDVSNEI
jgi:hypothetical protein